MLFLDDVIFDEKIEFKKIKISLTYNCIFFLVSRCCKVFFPITVPKTFKTCKK